MKKIIRIRGINGEAKRGDIGKMGGIRCIIGISFLILVMGCNSGLLLEKEGLERGIAF
ncbi:hypothetical protein [Borrelia persica]|uniref:hypothetical protein n=1 Tax=Borrelia persica TaxID=44448 RepID=UPI0004B35DB8|nr:hypothetical protein [Borrelia persica]